MSQSLQTLQNWFQSALLQPQTLAADSPGAKLLPGAMLNASACLAIYQRSYILRLRQCLAEQFPATQYALGEELFTDFADCYLADCPSNSYTLYDLGNRFADWLQANRPDRDAAVDDKEDWIDFMVDLASYECELFRLFDAPGHEGNAWPALDVADDNLVLQPCLSLTTYRYPVAWYYHEIRAGRHPAFPPQADCCNLILRRDYQTATFPVTPVHFRFLQSLASGKKISEALIEIAHWTEQPLEIVKQSWEREVRGAWIAAGFFITGIH